MNLLELLSDYTLRNVALGSAILGLTSGVLGSFAVLRRQSLLGDALAHAALPGVCLAFLVVGGKVPFALLIGGALSAWVAAMLVLTILRFTRIPEDGAIGVALSGFFGFGIALLTFIQKGNNANQSGLDAFIFGQAATIIDSDVLAMAGLAAVALVLVFLLYKEFKLITFDPGFASSLGWPTRHLETILTSLVALAVIVGLQTVGVVLMAAMLVAPAAAARQWTDRLGQMISLSSAFGAFSGVAGALISASSKGLPTGPVIILCVSALMLISLLFAPNRGVVWGWWLARARVRRFWLERLLLDAHVLFNHASLTVSELAQRRQISEAVALRELRLLESQGLARFEGVLWVLSESGHTRAHELERRWRHLPGDVIQGAESTWDEVGMRGRP